MSSMFNMDITQGVKTNEGSFLKPGIHKVVFKGIEKNTFEKDGVTSFVMDVLFDNAEGSYKHRLFAPTSAERTTTDLRDRNGGVVIKDNPSQVEQFMCTCRQIINATNPTVAEGIDKGTIVFAGKDFQDFIRLMIQYTADFVGKETFIKLLPNNQYASLPRYPAQVGKKGELYVSTKFIGEGLTLSSYELTQVQKAKNAMPTAMWRTTSDLTSGMVADFNKPTADDDLPF